MGLATIDPYSHKAQTKFYKIPEFGVNRPNSKQIQPFENVKIYKEMYGHLGGHNVWMTMYISLLIMTFLHGCTSVKTSLIDTKHGTFVNLSVLLLTFVDK